jgi:hypothetical protein
VLHLTATPTVTGSHPSVLPGTEGSDSDPAPPSSGKSGGRRRGREADRDICDRTDIWWLESRDLRGSIENGPLQRGRGRNRRTNDSFREGQLPEAEELLPAKGGELCHHGLDRVLHIVRVSLPMLWNFDKWVETTLFEIR